MYIDKNRLMLILVVYGLSIASISSAGVVSQTKIPLSVSNGIPFTHFKGEYYVDGFDVDENENLYFMGGQKATLSVFSPQKKIIFTKNYSEFSSSQIYLFKGDLYVYDVSYKRSNLYVLDKVTGKLTHEYVLRGAYHGSPFFFKDGKLIIENRFESSADQRTVLSHDAYDLLTGRKIGFTENLFDIPVSVLSKESNYEFVGIWNAHYVLWRIDLDKNIAILSLVREDGKIVSEKEFPLNIFGNEFSEGVNGHRILRNEAIYILGRTGSAGLITKIKLNDLFGVAHRF